MSILLALETSQRIGGVALRDPHGTVHVEMLAPRKRHDDDLLPAIDRVFARAGLKPIDLAGGAVAVSIGPGGFTGLRIAVSTIKMFAEALGPKVIAVPSALVAAESWNTTHPAATVDLRAVVALACKDTACWCTAVRLTQEGWHIEGQPGLRDAASLDVRGMHFVLADEHLPEPIRRLCEEHGVEVIEPSFDPRACLAVAARMERAGLWSDPLTLVPLYPREPEAVTLWDKKLQAASKRQG